MRDNTTVVVQTTVACDTARHSSCRGTVFSLTDAHLADCGCACHQDKGGSQ